MSTSVVIDGVRILHDAWNIWSGDFVPDCLVGAKRREGLGINDEWLYRDDLDSSKEDHHCAVFQSKGDAMQYFAYRVNKFTPAKPKIVCLCGSTKFEDAYELANAKETLKGNIVLSIGVNLRKQHHIGMALGVGSQSVKVEEEKMERVKQELDNLHFRKIDLADEVLILNVGGYIGDSTRRELEYARSKGKTVRFLEPEGVKFYVAHSND